MRKFIDFFQRACKFRKLNHLIEGDYVMMKSKLLRVIVLMVLVCSATGMSEDLVISNINRTGYTVQYNSLAAGQKVYIDRDAIFLVQSRYHFRMKLIS